MKFCNNNQIKSQFFTWLVIIENNISLKAILRRCMDVNLDSSSEEVAVLRRFLESNTF